MSKDVITRLKAVDEMSGPIGQISRNVGKFNQQCLSLQGIAGGVSKSLASMATSFMGPAAAIGALTTAIGNNIQTARQFEQSIAGLQSLTGMSGEALEDLKRKAIELGGSTTQTASQVAESFMLIGSKMPELLKDADALQTVTKAAIRLAEASGGDVTTSANALTAALNIMGEGASEAERYINVMAATSQQGTRNIQELTDIVFRAGQNARATGISFEELMAIAGAGTKEFASAEQAGQALGKLFLQLEKQGDNNLKPSVVGVTEAIKNLTEANFDTVTATKMFTKNGAAAYMSIIHNKDAILQLLPNIQGTNTALEQANTNTNTLNGSLNKLSSAWEQFNLQLNDSNGFLKDCVDVMTDLLTVVNNIDVEMPEMNGYLKEFITTFASSQSTILGVIANYDKWGKVLGFAKEQLHGLATEMQKGATGDQKNQWAADADKNFQAWRKKQLEARGLNRPALIDKAPEFDDSTEEGIKAHIKYLKELRSTADIAGREYGNLTSEITRLQNMLKGGVKPPKISVPTFENGVSIDTIKGLSEYKQMYQDIADKSERGGKVQADANGMVANISAFENILDEADKYGIQASKQWMESFYDSIGNGEMKGADFFQPMIDAVNEAKQQAGEKPIELRFDTGNIKEIKTPEMTTGFSGPSTGAFSAWAQSIQKQMSTVDITTPLYQNLQEQLADTTTLQNLVKTAMENGFSFKDLNFDVEGMWSKILGPEGVENAEWQGIVDAINAKLAELDLPPIQLKFETGEIDTKEESKGLKDVQKHAQGVSSALSAASSAFSQYAGESEEAAAAQKAFTIAAAIATLVGQFAAIPKGVDIWSWIAGTIAGTATLIATIAQIKSSTNSYAEGGWVGGSSGGYVGDAVPAFLNRGEYVMTQSDVETANNNLQSAQQNAGGGGRSTISGEQIVTVVNAYGRRTGRGEILR